MTSQPAHSVKISPFARASLALDRFFHFRERGSNVRTEVLAGLTTFSTLSYILIVNPMIMAQSGMDHGALITATAVVGAIFTVLMGLYTNYPLAMAPAMGVNAMVIGIFTAQGLADIDLRDLIVAATTVVTILIMALGSSADGVAIGFIVCVLMTVLIGKARTLKPAAYVLLGIFLLHYIVL